MIAERETYESEYCTAYVFVKLFVLPAWSCAVTVNVLEKPTELVSKNRVRNK